MGGFSWRDPSGDVFDLPYVPSSRDELQLLVEEEKKRRAESVAPPDAESFLKSGVDKIGEGAKWFFDSPVLKPVSEALRSPGAKPLARALVPGFSGAEAITGAISGGAAALGATMDQPASEVPDFRDIVGREAGEGIHAGLETVAPIDLVTAGLSGAAGALPKAMKGARILAKAARTSDVSEGLYGTGQVATGLAEGDFAKAGIGGVRMAGGLGGLISTKIPDVPEMPVPDKVELPNVEDFGPAAAEQDLSSAMDESGIDLKKLLGDTMDTFRPEGPKAHEAVRAAAQQAVDQLTPRLSQIMGEDVSGIKVVIGERTMFDAADKTMVLNPFDLSLRGDIGTVLKEAISHELGHQKGLHQFGQVAPSDLIGDTPIAKFEQTGVPDPDRISIDVEDYNYPTEGDFEGLSAFDRSSQIAEADPSLHEHSREARDPRAQIGNESELAFNDTMKMIESDPEAIAVLQKLEADLNASPHAEYYRKFRKNQPVVDPNSEPMMREVMMEEGPKPEEEVGFGPVEDLLPEGKPQPLGAVQSSSVEGGLGNHPSEGVIPVQEGVQGVQKGVQPPESGGEPGGGDSLEAGATLEATPIEAIAKESGIEVSPEPVKTTEAETPAIATEPEKPTLEAATPETKKGQSFVEFMKEKFGDNTTTARERALARAEWQRLKEERKIIKMAENAGIPPERIKELMEGAPKEGDPSIKPLSAWKRATQPVLENLGEIHPWLKKTFTDYVTAAETPAMKNIAEGYRIKKKLSGTTRREVVDVLDGKKNVAEVSPEARQAAIHYRAMLDQTWTDAISAGVRKAKDLKRQNYFPHKFAEGWDDNLVQNIYLDKNWNMRESSLEKARMGKRADYRRDLEVLDEYFLSAYRRIAEVQHFGKRLEVLRRFGKKHVSDATTAEWLMTNVRRVLGREHPGSFDRFAGHARHVQALSDLGLAAFYQPIQVGNTALYGGLGRSILAVKRIVKDAPNEVYDAIRSRALVPDITQEIVQGAYGAQEGIKSRSLQKFMWGIPTIDKWTRIHANTVGKMMVEDAAKGSKGALKDLKALGFDSLEDAPDFAERVGAALSDKALFRSGNLEVPGWSSSTPGKLATQYMRFMYRHALFVKDIFAQAGKGNVRPLSRFLVVAPTLIQPMAEVLYPIREGLREVLSQTVTEGEYDTEKVWQEAFGDKQELNWDDEIKWENVLRNKRIPWNHPLKRMLQNMALWGGIGIFQLAIERMMQSEGSLSEVGLKALAGPVATSVAEATGSVIKDVGRVKEDVENRQVPGKYTRKWGAKQIPVVGYPVSRRMSEELEE